MKIIHVVSARRLTDGQRKQLKFEHDASFNLECAEWKCVAYHTGLPVETFERRIPFVFRSMFLKNLYVWINVLKLSRECDALLLRHITFDPFAFIFAPLVRNRISIHHSKEVEELKLVRPGIAGNLASALETISGRFGVRRTIGILGVTDDIAHYQQHTRSPGKPCWAYPNGISSDHVHLVKDHRSDGKVNAVFMCGKFNEWHGLDRLVDAVDLAGDQDSVAVLTINLIGHLSDWQTEQISATALRRRVFKTHGTLAPSEYANVLAGCDIGIGSLAMDRQNLLQGATLKVRELLAMGIPVYSAHEDVSLPSAFAHYYNADTISVLGIFKFAAEQKQYSRQAVRDASLPFIEKSSMLRSVVTWLQTLT